MPSCRVPPAAIPRHVAAIWVHLLQLASSALPAALDASLLEAHCLERTVAKAWCCVALLAGDGTEARVSRH